MCSFRACLVYFPLLFYIDSPEKQTALTRTNTGAFWVNYPKRAVLWLVWGERFSKELLHLAAEMLKLIFVLKEYILCIPITTTEYSWILS